MVHQADLVGAWISLGVAAFAAGFLYWSISSEDQDFTTVLCQAAVGILGLLSFVWGLMTIISWCMGATLLP